MICIYFYSFIHLSECVFFKQLRRALHVNQALNVNKCNTYFVSG